MLNGLPANVGFLHLGSEVAGTNAEGISKLVADAGTKLSPTDAQAIATEGASKGGLDVSKLPGKLGDDAGLPALFALLGKDGYMAISTGNGTAYVARTMSLFGGRLTKAIERDTGVRYGTLVGGGGDAPPGLAIFFASNPIDAGAKAALS